MLMVRDANDLIYNYVQMLYFVGCVTAQIAYLNKRQFSAAVTHHLTITD